MELTTATNLIKPGVPAAPGQCWWDLGAGSGLFTIALANLLKDGSIIAVDKDASVMKNIPDRIGNIAVKKLGMDFGAFTSPPGQPNGILMANSLHFIESKLSFLTMLKSLLRPNGRLIIIEYELSMPNAWVPFPINFNSLSELAATVGFSEVRKISTTTSRFQNNGIYSALLC